MSGERASSFMHTIHFYFYKKTKLRINEQLFAFYAFADYSLMIACREAIFSGRFYRDCVVPGYFVEVMQRIIYVEAVKI